MPYDDDNLKGFDFDALFGEEPKSTKIPGDEAPSNETPGAPLALDDLLAGFNKTFVSEKPQEQTDTVKPTPTPAPTPTPTPTPTPDLSFKKEVEAQPFSNNEFDSFDNLFSTVGVQAPVQSEIYTSPEIKDNPVTEVKAEDTETLKPESKGKKIGRLIFNLLFYVICIAIVAGSAAFALSNDPGKNYLGYRFYSVKTPSMTPSEDSPEGGFYAGDMIIVKVCNEQSVKDIKVGDVITFMPNANAESYLTHRVVAIKNQINNTQGLFFVTRGDTNNTDDPPISSEMVIGKKVFSIRYVGKVLVFIRSNLILCLVIAISAFGFIFTLRYYFSGPKKKKEE